MRRPIAMDLFCKAGGATKGLQLAGFHVIGVDIEPQPRYCGDEFIQADALTVPLRGAFIWASPPCQAYSIASLSQRNSGKRYPDLIAPTRARLLASGIPFSIENVPGAPLRVDLRLCGSQFGLRTIRHRIFELSFDELILVPSCAHPEVPITVVGRGTPSWNRAKNGGKCFGITEYRKAMGIDWMNRGELSEAVPPAYSEYIGKFAMRLLDAGRG